MPTYKLVVQRLILQEAIIEVEEESLEDAISEFESYKSMYLCEADFDESSYYVEEISERVYAAEDEDGVMTFAKDSYIDVRWDEINGTEEQGDDE